MPAIGRARAALVPLAILSITAAQAQQQQPAAPENAVAAWRVECTGDGKTLDCRAVQQVFHRESRQLLVSVTVRPAADGKTGALVATLPLGLNLTEPVTVRVDGSGGERQPIQTCTNVGCFLTLTVSDKLIAAMRSGRELKFAMQDANKKPVEIGLPLLGFGLAFDKAR